MNPPCQRCELYPITHAVLSTVDGKDWPVCQLCTMEARRLNGIIGKIEVVSIGLYNALEEAK